MGVGWISMSRRRGWGLDVVCNLLCYEMCYVICYESEIVIVVVMGLKLWIN